MTLQELSEKIIEAWKPIEEQIEKLLDALRKAFEKIEEHERLLRRPPKWYIKANTPTVIVSRSKLYHCRSNC